MSCAQVMYQPYAPSPYVVQPDTPQTPHGTGSATTAAAPTGESRLGEGGGGGGGPPVLHLPQPATSAITPHTPPHAHHHHHHHQQQQQQTSQPLSQAQLQRNSEAGTSSSSSSSQIQQTQQQPSQATTQQNQGQQQPQASTSAAERSGAQRSLVRPPYRVSSNGSATADPEAPPPEKKFCSESEAPPAPSTPSSSSSSSSLPHGHHAHHHQGASHQQHQHHHHHHHHHSTHHHPPHTEPPGSPTQHSNQHQQEVKYVSANCMVVTHYAGDTSAVVDEHFTRALSTPHYEKPHSPGKAASPMSSRNFPPSFWNSNYQSPSTSSSSRPPSLAGHLAGTSPADLYDPYHGGLHSLQPPAPDPWAAYSLSSQAYGHRSVAHDVYQAMSSVPSSSRPYHQYSSLSFQPHLARLPGVTPVASQMPMAKPESWGARYHEAFSNPELAHGLETNYPAAHYPNVPGLETGVPQEGAKDLYWF